MLGDGVVEEGLLMFGDAENAMMVVMVVMKLRRRL